MKNKDSFILYNDYEKYFSLLTPSEAGLVLMKIFEYQKTGLMPVFFSGACEMLFHFIKSDIDENKEVK